MPHFMVNKVPVGLLGLVISAILAAAMSTISSGMNASATVFTEDVYKRYIRPQSTNKQSLRMLFIATGVFGVLGMVAGVGMIGEHSRLDAWWELSGSIAGGMIGLFMLGLLSNNAGNGDAVIGVFAGLFAFRW